MPDHSPSARAPPCGTPLAPRRTTSANARITRTRRSVILSYLFLFVGAGIYAPYFPLYLRQLGLSGATIGTLTGTQPILRWVSAIAAAQAADRFRFRYRLLVALGAAGTLSFVPILWVEHPAALFGVLAAVSVLHGPLLPMLDATVLDHLDALGGDYGRLRLWGSAAFVAGALGAAPLVEIASPHVLPGVLLLSVVGVAPALAGLPSGQLGHARSAGGVGRLLSRPMVAFLATAVLINVSSGAWQGFFAIHTRALGLPDATTGIAYGLAVIAEIALFFWGRAVLARVDAASLILFASVVTALRWAGTAVATTLVPVVALQLLHVVTFSMFHLAAMRLLTLLIPVESSTSGQALYGLLAFGIGGGAGVALAGRLIDRMGTSRVFGVEALVAAAAILPAVVLRRLVRTPR